MVAASRLRIGIRIGGAVSRRQSFLLGSLLAHVAFVALVLLLPGLFGRPEINADYMPVELVGSLPAADPAPPTPVPRPAAPTPQPPEPQEEVTAQPVEPKVVKKPRPEPKKPAPAPAAATPPPAEVPSRAVGSAEAGGSVAPLEGGDVEFAWYRSSVTAALYSQWQRPILTAIREPLEVQIEFEILRDGTVRGLRIAGPSGVPSMDRSALRAVSDASPLPPLPSAWREASLPATFIFRLYPEDF